MQVDHDQDRRSHVGEHGLGADMPAAEKLR